MKRRAFLLLAVAVVLPAVSCNMANLERTSPKTAEEYQSRGLEHFDNDDYDGAIAEFTKAINLDPDFAEAYNSRSGAYYIRSQVYQSRASAYADKGDWEMSFAEWELFRTDYDHSQSDYFWYMYICAVRIDPNDAEAYNNRAWAYYYKDDYNRAIEDFTKSILLDPNNARTFVFRGIAYFEDDCDYDSAIADYNQSIRLNPNDAWVHYCREQYIKAGIIGAACRGNSYFSGVYLLS
jgi:tetratricopeptide (TPR) repeat protein